MINLYGIILSNHRKKWVAAMSIKTLSSKNNITRQQQEEADQQIRQECELFDYHTVEYPLEVIAKKILDGQDNDDNELLIPNYHRDTTWDEQQQSNFIESIFLGLPIPSIYIVELSNESKDVDRWELIDGSQRLLTLIGFITDKLKLQHLEILNKLEGFHFSDLPPARQRRFKRTSIRFVQFTKQIDKETRINLCKRINGKSI